MRSQDTLLGQLIDDARQCEEGLVDVLRLLHEQLGLLSVDQLGEGPCRLLPGHDLALGHISFIQLSRFGGRMRAALVLWSGRCGSLGFSLTHKANRVWPE